MLDRSFEIAGGVLALCTLIGVVFGYLRVIRPRWRNARARVAGALDALVGRDAIVDSITDRVLAPALPGIGVRMETVERAVAHIAQLLDSQQSQDVEIAEIRAELLLLADRVRQLEEGAIERVATKAESISAFRAIEAVAKSTEPAEPDPTTGELP